MRLDKHFRLRTLGRLALETQVGDINTPAAVRPRHLALLTVLAVSPRALRRDVLAAMFWGEETDARARHSLSNTLSALRAVLGASSISARRDEVGLNPELRLAVDALEFAAAAESRDDARAAALYGGPFLDDVFVPDAPGFDAWVARERSRFERLFLSMCERHAPALLRAGAWNDCAGLAERWLYAAPQSTLAFTTLLRARSGPGTPSARRTALDDYARLSDWLAREHGLRPDAAVGDIVSELEMQVAAGEHAMAERLVEPRADAPPASSATPAPASPAPAGSAPPPVAGWTTRWIRPALAIAAVVAVVGVAMVIVRGQHDANAAPTTRTVVAITDIANLRGDTALAWLEDGLPQIISDNLAGEGPLEPVSPVRVRDVLLRRGAPLGAPLAASDAMDLARRVGATWAVRGGLTGGKDVYILDLDVRDVATGASLQSFTVMSADPVQLGRLAAARLLDLASSTLTVGSEAPRFVGAATTQPEAYRHYVLGLTASSEHRGSDAAREFDAAIALDSGFVGALSARHDIAASLGDRALATRLDSLIVRHPDRMSDWDRLVGEITQADVSGAVDRSEALAERLVARYPRDPRAYDLQAFVLSMHGRWLAADSVYGHELSLDSLAMEAGNGPCAPCGAYSGLVGLRLVRGDLAGAEQAARRWVALQPGVPGSWEMLSMALEFSGRAEESIEAARRVASLTTDPVRTADLGRALLVARRFGAVDSLVRVLRQRPGGLADATDLAATLARERGQFRRSIALLQPMLAFTGLELVQADNLMRVGRVADARRLYERAGHDSLPRDVEAMSAEQSRAFAWAHALEGDALWRTGDTTAAHALMDSVRHVGARSYYGRDWRLYHHLAGLLALSHGDTATAETELSAARWGAAGWTTTVVQLGAIQLAHGNAAGAIAYFHQALHGPLDAMGRYVPRTEIDAWLARAFARAGQADSAHAYAALVREAWKDADPDVRARLAALPK
ncbi:MAG TPA: BTAD domain-containing putative transcriptional regulator [Gemmatimonadaceae bacterium]|nr:BTAD domain-containing putative transcriptional regulator [Gemmatimonadaceae bacterium]